MWSCHGPCEAAIQYTPSSFRALVSVSVGEKTTNHRVLLSQCTPCTKETASSPNNSSHPLPCTAGGGGGGAWSSGECPTSRENSEKLSASHDLNTTPAAEEARTPRQIDDDRKNQPGLHFVPAPFVLVSRVLLEVHTYFCTHTLHGPTG